MFASCTPFAPLKSLNQSTIAQLQNNKTINVVEQTIQGPTARAVQGGLPSSIEKEAFTIYERGISFEARMISACLFVWRVRNAERQGVCFGAQDSMHTLSSPNLLVTVAPTGHYGQLRAFLSVDNWRFQGRKARRGLRRDGGFEGGMNVRVDSYRLCEVSKTWNSITEEGENFQARRLVVAE